MFDPLYGTLEVQAKFVMNDLAAAERAVTKVDVQPRFYRNTEVDRFYRVAGAAGPNGYVLKLRTRHPYGETLLISQSLNSYGMIAVNVDSAERTRQLLNTHGFQFIGEVSKIRSMYIFDKFNVKIDETPAGDFFIEIGTFLTDSGLVDMAIVAIYDLAQSMGLDLKTESTRRHYHALTELREPALGSTDGDG